MATLRSMPVFEVKDVPASVAFYQRLGFDCHGLWGEPPAFSIVQRGDVTIALDRSRRHAPLPLNQGWAAYIYVQDADALYDEFKTEGVKLREAPCDQPYGCRDFTLADVDGHQIAFGHDLDPGAPGLGVKRGKG